MAEKVDEIVKGHCPNCGPRRFSDVKGHYRESSDDEETGIWDRKDYRILVCRGCAAAYMQTEYLFSEDVDHRQRPDGEWEEVTTPTIEHWPSPIKRAEPNWMVNIHMHNFNLGALFSDVYRCLNAGLGVPATVATRTAFDSATELLGINPTATFAKKLDDLLALGKISIDERNVLEILVDAGSAAAHRGWRPKAVELNTLVSLIESFFHRTFVLGEEAKRLKDSVPERTKSKGKKK